MYCEENRIYCVVCNKSYKGSKCSIHLRPQGHITNVMKNQCANSMNPLITYSFFLNKFYINISNNNIFF